MGALPNGLPRAVRTAGWLSSMRRAFPPLPRKHSCQAVIRADATASIWVVPQKQEAFVPRGARAFFICVARYKPRKKKGAKHHEQNSAQILFERRGDAQTVVQSARRYETAARSHAESPKRWSRPRKRTCILFSVRSWPSKSWIIRRAMWISRKRSRKCTRSTARRR